MVFQPGNPPGLDPLDLNALLLRAQRVLYLPQAVGDLLLNAFQLLLLADHHIFLLAEHLLYLPNVPIF